MFLLIRTSQNFLIFMRKLIRELYYFYLRIPHIIRGTKVNHTTFIRPHVTLRKCKIGKYCYIGEYSDCNNVEIGNYCSIANGVIIGNMEHDVNDLSTSVHLSDSGNSEMKTKIGNDVWIGAQCFIKQGVKIGNGAVIGAQTFINKDVPPYSITVGTPGRLLRYRFSGSTIKLLEESEYWVLSPSEAKETLNTIKKQI